MPRLMLTYGHWSKLKPILLQQRIYDKGDLRITVESILYRMRTGCQWRGLPNDFGHWNTVYKRFNAWSAAGNTSKIHLVVYAYGLPIVFRITGGEVHDSIEAQALIDELPTGGALVAGRGYDSACIREQMISPVIPCKRNSRAGNSRLDRGAYRYSSSRRECLCSVEAVSRHSNALRQAQAKLRKHGGISL